MSYLGGFFPGIQRPWEYYKLIRAAQKVRPNNPQSHTAFSMDFATSFYCARGRGLATDIDRAAARLKISVLTYGHLPSGSRIASTAMIRYKEIAFVAYPVTDIARARKFYEGVLGFKPNAPLKSETQMWIEYDIGHGTLGIGCSEQWKPSEDGPSVALEVQDFNVAIATLREHNVPIIIGPLEMPTCDMATVRDPDGNKLTIHRRKQSS